MKTKRLLTILICSLFLVVPVIVKAEATITAEKNEIKVDEETTVTAICPDDFAASITSTSNATVDENGKVTGVAEGTATITVTCTKEGEENQSASVPITIKAKEEASEPTQTPEPPQPDPEVVISIKSVKIDGATAEKAGDNGYNLNVTNEDTFKTAIKNLKKNLKIDSDFDVTSITDIDSRNTFKVTLKDSASDKTKQFTFNIKYPEANTYLASLKISGYAFNQTFDKETLSYTVTVPYDVREVTIYATPEDPNAKVTPGTTIDRDDLEVGGNTITIKVTNGGKTRTYRVFVTRSEDDSPEDDGKPTSIIKTKITSTSGFDIPETENPDSPLKIAIITLGAIILFLIGGCGIYFYFKTSPKRMKKELMKQKKKKVESPIVETPTTNVEDLEKTKEFKNL